MRVVLETTPIDFDFNYFSFLPFASVKLPTKIMMKSIKVHIKNPPKVNIIATPVPTLPT